MAFEPVNEGFFRRDLIAWRREYGITRERLADLAGTSVSTLTRFEKGRQTPRLDVYNRLAALMAIEVGARWWDYEKQFLFVCASGFHDERLFAGLVYAWLFQRRYQRAGDTAVLVVDGKEVMLYEPDFPGAAGVETGFLVRLPCDYGYKEVEERKQGAFGATWMRLGWW